MNFIQTFANLTVNTRRVYLDSKLSFRPYGSTVSRQLIATVFIHLTFVLSSRDIRFESQNIFPLLFEKENDRFSM